VFERLRRWGQRGGDLLYPPACVHCREEMALPEDRIAICPRCRVALLTDRWQACRRCGAPLGEFGTIASRCLQCRNVPIRFDAVIPFGLYRNDLQHAVLRMKSRSGDPISKALGTWMASHLHRRLAAWEPELVVPISAHWSRRFFRGTNSPDLLAACIARNQKIPMFSSLLQWQRKVSRQSSLRRSERFRNVRGALRVRTSYDVKGACVLLVDDILTTGATASAAAEALCKAGAGRVIVAVLARTIGSESL